MKYNLGLNKVLGTIHIYPTMAEANKYVAGDWKRNQVNPKLLLWFKTIPYMAPLMIDAKLLPLQRRTAAALWL